MLPAELIFENQHLEASLLLDPARVKIEKQTKSKGLSFFGFLAFFCNLLLINHVLWEEFYGGAAVLE
jgi:hypothetical protein